eukprot:1669763-Alexandrium_andersonii.AAC.1
MQGKINEAVHTGALLTLTPPLFPRMQARRHCGRCKRKASRDLGAPGLSTRSTAHRCSTPRSHNASSESRSDQRA